MHSGVLNHSNHLSDLDVSCGRVALLTLIYFAIFSDIGVCWKCLGRIGKTKDNSTLRDRLFSFCFFSRCLQFCCAMQGCSLVTAFCTRRIWVASSQRCVLSVFPANYEHLPFMFEINSGRIESTLPRVALRSVIWKESLLNAIVRNRLKNSRKRCFDGCLGLSKQIEGR